MTHELKNLTLGLFWLLSVIDNHPASESRQRAFQAPNRWVVSALLSPNQSHTAAAHTTRKTIFVCF